MKDLDLLIQLSQIDKNAAKLEPKITAIEEELHLKIKAQKEAQNEWETLKTTLKKLQLSIANNEGIIEDNSEKVEQLEKKMASVKSESEIRALDVESGLAKEKIAFANEEIAKLETLIAHNKAKEATLLTNIEAIKKEVEATKIDVEKRSAEIRGEMQKIYDGKGAIAKDIDPKIVLFYDKIRRWAKDGSVASVLIRERKSDSHRIFACGGCFEALNDRIYIELLKKETLVTCPHCGRIIYIKDDELEEAHKAKTKEEKPSKTPAKKSTKSATKTTKKAAGVAEKSAENEGEEVESGESKSGAKATKSAAKTATKSSAATKSTAAKTSAAKTNSAEKSAAEPAAKSAAKSATKTTTKKTTAKSEAKSTKK